MSHINKTFFITLGVIVMLTDGILFGQLEDISRKIPSRVVQMEKLGEMFVLTGKSEPYSSENTPEGVAVLLDKSTTEMEALFRFLDIEGNLTEWIQGDIINIPYSERSIIYIRDELCKKYLFFQNKVI